VTAAGGPGSGAPARASCSPTSTRRTAAATGTRASAPASQQHLREWTEQEWHTADGDDRARGSDGTSRYLPDAAWQLLSDEEKRATDRRKKSGEDQHVANTDAAREARKAAELIDVDAAEARKRVGQMSGDSQLDRAERAERDLGKGRKTVLEAIERRRHRD